MVYRIQTVHELRAAWEWCEPDPPYECNDWYDAFGYSFLPPESPPYSAWVEQIPPMVWCWALGATVVQAITDMQSQTPAPSLKCNDSTETTVTRGDHVTCMVSGAGYTSVSGWSFTHGETTYPGPSSGWLWGGDMVIGGTVKATIPNYGQVQAGITVNNRSWSAQTVTPQEVPNGTFVTLPTPPYFGYGTLGQFRWQAYRTVPNPTMVSGGPNNGFYYFAGPLSLDQFFLYQVNPDLTNAQSTFAQKQYGACGVISRADLENNVRQHESSGAGGVHSHYNQYVASLTNPDHDPHVYVETRWAGPGTNPQNLRSTTDNGAGSLLAIIGADADSEAALYAADQNQTTGQHMGNINWPPYPYTCP